MNSCRQKYDKTTSENWRSLTGWTSSLSPFLSNSTTALITDLESFSTIKWGLFEVNSCWTAFIPSCRYFHCFVKIRRTYEIMRAVWLTLSNERHCCFDGKNAVITMSSPKTSMAKLASLASFSFSSLGSSTRKCKNSLKYK